eukprot:11617312-Alexandrium_andersonii.AAC.1
MAEDSAAQERGEKTRADGWVEYTTEEWAAWRKEQEDKWSKWETRAKERNADQMSWNKDFEMK